MDSQHLLETKLFIYSAGGAVMMAITTWFLRDLVSTVKEVSKSLNSQNLQIERILSRLERHGERLDFHERLIERGVDK